jgi:hypothetical protein
MRVNVDGLFAFSVETSWREYCASFPEWQEAVAVSHLGGGGINSNAIRIVA